jgi:hypothetical protein
MFYFSLQILFEKLFPLINILCITLGIRSFCKILTKNGICRTVLVKRQTTEFHENLFSRSGVVRSGQRDKHGDISGIIFKLFVANMSKKQRAG